MSGVNFNITTNKAGASGTTSGDTSKAFLTTLSFAPNASGTIPDSYADIPGVVNQSVTFNKTGEYLFILNITGMFPSATQNTSVFAKILIDDVQVAEIDNASSGLTYYADATQKRIGFVWTLGGSVSAGNHNVKIQFKANTGQGGRTNRDSQSLFYVTIM